MSDKTQKHASFDELDLQEAFEEITSFLQEGKPAKSNHKHLLLAAVAAGLMSVVLFAVFLPAEQLPRLTLIIAVLTAAFFGWRTWNFQNHPLRNPAELDSPESFDDIKDALTPSEEELKVTAIHEAGHAVCCYHLPHYQGIERIELATQESAKKESDGCVFFKLPKNTLLPESALKSMIATRLSGTISERVFLGESFGGSEQDLAAAAQLAYTMTAFMGMGKRIGLCIPVNNKNYWTADLQADMRDIIDECSELSEKTLLEHRDQVEALAALLIEKRSLNEEDVKNFFVNN